MISIYLTILISLVILRVFANSLFVLKTKHKILSEKERGIIGTFWFIVSCLTAILFVQEVLV